MRFAHDVDAGETSRFAGSSAQQLVAPGIQQSRALHHDRLLLLHSDQRRSAARINVFHDRPAQA
jgi:hypothetical protein